MDLFLLKEGKTFTLYSISTGEENDVRECLKNLKQFNDDEFERIKARIVHLADHGPRFDKTKYRELGNGLYEIKTRKGSRVLFFYDEFSRWVIICTHIFKKDKKKKQSKEIELGRKAMSNFALSKKNASIKIIVDGNYNPNRMP